MIGEEEQPLAELIIEHVLNPIAATEPKPVSLAVASKYNPAVQSLEVQYHVSDGDGSVYVGKEVRVPISDELKDKLDKWFVWDNLTAESLPGYIVVSYNYE